MSISGIFSSSFTNNQLNTQYQLTNSEFQQLGQDLSSGNLSAAQSDFSILQQAFAQPAASTANTSTTSSASSNTIAQEFQQLSSDLKSGNLSAAQKDYSTIQQGLQSELLSHHLHGHHHSRAGSAGADLFNQLTQDPTSSTSQSSNLAATQAYSVLAQQLQEVALGDGTAGVENTAANPVSVVA